ncbi:hypothetical protein [Pseudomonas violetae]|jgi:mannose-6-phosphate isomerase-like protein (cupin superfamily)|uniref:Cupin 2 conserved barrel domain-containing protein n=1 Tax=Pseudomonas violetae TaxID=2915813 RepID=A0ABT0EWZ4_9PSED|nr:hypothetical protein [Pseudomonas violetae]MCK1790282.1 hypothetical protein [Pseudomonas violetae]
MNVENSEAILLIPGGYLVWIDVDEASVGGAGTAMRFDLPLHAHNLPLMHSHETKLVVALRGELDIRSGRQRIALLHEGDAIQLEPGIAHRIHQVGSTPSVVGAVLWPGAVERAFREIAALVVRGTYQRSEMIRLLSRYGVIWAEKPLTNSHQTVAVRPFFDFLREMPSPLAHALEHRWK